MLVEGGADGGVFGFLVPGAQAGDGAGAGEAGGDDVGADSGFEGHGVLVVVTYAVVVITKTHVGSSGLEVSVSHHFPFLGLDRLQNSHWSSAVLSSIL